MYVKGNIICNRDQELCIACSLIPVGRAAVDSDSKEVVTVRASGETLVG